MKRPLLMVSGGALDGEKFDVPEGGLRLGRSSSNDIHVADEGLSRSHCLFERDGEDSIRVIDLASANGTYVNGELLGGDPRRLSPGDRIEAGGTAILVVGEGAVPPAAPPAGGAVDLGFGETGGGESAAQAPAKKRSPVASIVWAALAIAVAAAIAAVLLVPRDGGGGAIRPVEEKTRAEIDRPVYEKVEADSTRIFRYIMTIENGELRVAFDDVPEQNRHVDKKAALSDRAKARIAEIFETRGFDALENSYSGGSGDDGELKSWRIRTVSAGKVRDILVENTLEPDAFRTVREALEAFSRNELGIWAIQYTSEKLIELCEASAAVGDAKWEEREVEYGNLSAAVRAYREAIFYLDTVNPKPAAYSVLKQKLAAAEEELSRRYKEQRFIADKAINLGDWESAKTELAVLCEMVPDKDDERHAEANAKLVDVENRMKKAKGGRQ